MNSRDLVHHILAEEGKDISPELEHCAKQLCESDGYAPDDMVMGYDVPGYHHPTGARGLVLLAAPISPAWHAYIRRAAVVLAAKEEYNASQSRVSA